MQCGAGKRRLAQRLLNLSSSFRRAENSIAWQKFKVEMEERSGFVRNLKIYETVNLSSYPDRLLRRLCDPGHYQ